MTYCANCLDKDETIIGLANRLAAASEVLGELAKRDGRVAEIMRLRGALERIVEGDDAIAVATQALRVRQAE